MTLAQPANHSSLPEGAQIKVIVFSVPLCLCGENLGASQRNLCASQSGSASSLGSGRKKLAMKPITYALPPTMAAA